MAIESLSDFFDQFYHGPQKAVMYYKPIYQRDVERQIERNLRKAVIRVACGPYAPAMRQAASAWEPTIPAHVRLKAAMLAENPPRLAVTRVVTRVRKALEMWLREHYLQFCPPIELTRRKLAEIKCKEKYKQEMEKHADKFRNQERRMIERFAKAAGERRSTKALT